MNRGKIRKGSRVKLNPESQFYSKNILMNENPTDCEGTVYDVDSIFLPIRVKWDNGTKNDYDESDLILLNQGENQRGSVATDEDQGGAADPQITPPQLRLLDLQEKIYQQERELERLRGEREALVKLAKEQSSDLERILGALEEIADHVTGEVDDAVLMQRIANKALNPKPHNP